MEDYFGCNLVGEMEILRIIDEFNLFCNRPYSGSTYFFIEAQLKKKKYVEVMINDFTMHLIILKWLRKQKCTQKRKNETKSHRSERRNCLRKCFH